MKYPRWLIIWFAISFVASVITVIVAPIIHPFVPDVWKPVVWLVPALAFANLSGALLVVEKKYNP
jgi:hypothetical protein